MQLYTGAGDSGRASTRTRMNIPKSSPVFELLGTLDEFTSTLGVVRQKTPAAVAEILTRVQENVLALSEELAGGERFATKEQVAKLEQAIDSLAGSLPEETSAQVGASEGSAALELARAVARKAERRAVAMAQTGGVPREVLAWLNRLSALLAALARVCDLGQPAPAKTPAAVQTIRPAGEGFFEQALILCRAVQAHARQQGLRVVTAVCDAGGNPVVLLRDDDAYIASVDIAANKAFTSVSLKMTTAELGRLAQPGAPLYGVQHTNSGRIVIFGGGVPLVREGAIVGGFGVSGGSAEQDTALADYALDFFGKEML